MSATASTMHPSAWNITAPVFTADLSAETSTSSQRLTSFLHLPYELRYEIYLYFFPDASSSWAKRPKAGPPQTPGPRLSCVPPESHYLGIKRRRAEIAREFNRQQIQRERDRIQCGGDWVKCSGPRIRKLTPERIPPGRELLCVSKQVYREFAPLFYRYTCKNVVFKGHRVGIPNEKKHEDWGLDHLEILLSPQSTAFTMGHGDGTSPIYLCESIQIYIPNLATRALARRWLSALSRLEEITTEGQKSGLSRLRYLCIKFRETSRHENYNATEPPEWDGSTEDASFDADNGEKATAETSITTTSSSSSSTMAIPALRPVRMVLLDMNIALAKTICRFRGLEKLTLHGFDDRVWPRTLLENMRNPDLVLWRAGQCRVRCSGEYMNRHDTLYGMKAIWERKDKVAGPAKEKVRNQLYKEHVAAYHDYGRWTRPLCK